MRTWLVTGAGSGIGKEIAETTIRTPGCVKNFSDEELREILKECRE
ncbi:MAG: hypothetical protein ACI4W2_02770 [Eubacterium sp.]